MKLCTFSLVFFLFIATCLHAQKAEDYYKTGKQKYADGAYEEAILYFTKAIQINPQYANAYMDRGLSLDALSYYQSAIQDFNIVIELKKDSVPDAYHNRGMAYKNFTKYTEAIQDFDKAIALNFNYPLTYNYRGICLDNIGRYDEALQDFNKAIEMSPKKASYYYNRGNTLNHLRQYKAAIDDYKTALAIDPNLDAAKSGLKEAQQKLNKKAN
ncbi:tetratricopeptide repeat protein [Emticicia agri]|uniref:Tetratricopeptide repeat protein n=1 Tax=Emticicia agri TaxID=2492393 RepID=A0A4Q5LT93_9BACT|nr:tetratricopeptide repeat protein [Emticicia agri]RYU92774.1 tetratricopeptide repeat protein [Emticicia agri]